MSGLLFKKKNLNCSSYWAFLCNHHLLGYLFGIHTSPSENCTPCIHSSTIKMGPEMFYETLVSPVIADWTRHRHLPEIEFSCLKWDHRTMSEYMSLRVRGLIQPCAMVKDNIY